MILCVPDVSKTDIRLRTCSSVTLPLRIALNVASRSGPIILFKRKKREKIYQCLFENWFQTISHQS